MSSHEFLHDFSIHFKHPEHGSDILDVTFKSRKSAIKFISLLELDPARQGYSSWLSEATLWVSDAKGNIVYS